LFCFASLIVIMTNPKGQKERRKTDDGMLSLGDNKLVETFMITETKVQARNSCGFCGSFSRRGQCVYKGQPASWNLSWILVIMSWFGCLSALRLCMYEGRRDWDWISHTLSAPRGESRSAASAAAAHKSMVS
jgi:hypothetical protein